MAERTMTRDWERKIITILGVEYDYNKLSQEMKEMAGFLGFGTKLVDNLAGMKAYTQEEKTLKVGKVYDNLLLGNWRVPGEGGGKSGKKVMAEIYAAYQKANKSDRATMEKCLAGQGYDFSSIE